MIRMTVLPRGSIYDRNPDTPVLPVLACPFPGVGFTCGLIERHQGRWEDAVVTIDTREGSVEVSGLPAIMGLMKQESGGLDPFVALPIGEDVIGVVAQDGTIGTRIERSDDGWNVVDGGRSSSFPTLDAALDAEMAA